MPRIRRASRAGGPWSAGPAEREAAGWFAFENLVNHGGFVRPAGQKHYFTGVIQDRKREADAVGFEFFHPVGDYQLRVFFQALGSGKSDAVWPSGPMPSRIRSKRGKSLGLSSKNLLSWAS